MFGNLHKHYNVNYVLSEVIDNASISFEQMVLRGLQLCLNGICLYLMVFLHPFKEVVTVVQLPLMSRASIVCQTEINFIFIGIHRFQIYPRLFWPSTLDDHGTVRNNYIVDLSHSLFAFLRIKHVVC